MTTKKTAASRKKASAAAKPKAETEETSPDSVTEAAGPEMEGEAYQVGYVGVSSDDEDYSIAAEVKRLDES